MISEKRVVVTGASSGIGNAVAELLQQEGAHVIALSRSRPSNSDIEHLKTDLRHPDEIATSFKKIEHCDILINNAGMAYSSSIVSGSLEEWNEMWEVNVRALAYACQLALKGLPKTGGQIINISSMSGHRVPPSGGFYAPTKFAVRAITESLRLELRSRGNSTRVSSISPGFVDTPLLDTYFRGKEDQLEQTKQAIKMLTPEDIASQVLNILKTPLHVEVGDIAMRSVSQTV